MICLFDTSALVKLLVTEPGSDTAVAIWNRVGTPVASRLAEPELAAALAAARRARRLDAAELASVEARATGVLRQITWIELGARIGHLAAELAAAHALSGADAVHLAAAMSLGDESTVATFDERLRAASAHLGLALLPAQTS